ncbi:D111/G-patch domain-containing protein [Tasmannia lanceolata]|uniref:D111/G-patch domain-containing protein n=1 Tax=Tasmannia lanceolata TaxID=3420 RepID=UPI004062E5F8
MAEKEAEEEDYMGDLSRFLSPPEVSHPSISSSKKIPNTKTLIPQSSKKKKTNALNWQEQRKIDRERKQKEEDEQTLARCESAIPPSNVGFKMLQQMGYRPGSALGRAGLGRADPVGLTIRRSRAGLGRESPEKQKERKEKFMFEKKRKKEEDLMAEFGSRQKTNWRVRRVLGDFNKARAALFQLENREIVEVEKDKEEENEGDEKAEEEEEEEEITEEDLQDILMKLRAEHRYCLYCGCQYESVEALSSSCPGPNEDDH